MPGDVYERGRSRTQSLDRTAVRAGRLLSQPGVRHEYGRPTPDRLLSSVLKAIEARRHAESYRAFGVGASASVDSVDGTKLIIKHGANYKDGPGDSRVDEHAEQMVLSTLAPDDHIAVLAVVGQTQEDHGSGLHTSTLHPCSKCRQLLADSPQVDETTVIVCATPDVSAVQWGLLDDYQRVHDGGPDMLQVARFAVTPELFRPLPDQSTFMLTPDLDIDTVEWDTKVTFPFIEWAAINL